MGFGDFLRSLFSTKSSAVRRNDKIWLTQGAKLRGIVRDVERALDENTIPLVVAHFPNMLRGMQTLLEGTGRPFEILEKSDRLQEWTDRLIRHDPPRVFLAESANLPETVATSDSARDDSGTVSIIVVESHPLPAGNEAVERFAESLPCRCRLQIHLSLDDAVMQVFAGEGVVGMLRKLGMKEDEAIERYDRLVLFLVDVLQQEPGFDEVVVRIRPR